MRHLLLGLFCLLAAACGPNPTKPIQAMVLSLSSSGNYQPKQVTLKTLDDVLAMKGSVATLIGGARVVVDSNDPLLSGPLTNEQITEVFIKNHGGDPRASWIEQKGVLWPADFHTWNMATTYANFERSFDYWQAIYDGAPTTELDGAKVFYWVDFTLADVSPTPMRDNATWFSPIQGFSILPFESLQQVPLSINLGVVAHEYAHRVFNLKVYKGSSFPEPLLRWIGISASTPGVNLLKSMDEGFADFHGYGVTCGSDYSCDPRYLRWSLPADISDPRDFTRADRCLTDALGTALTTQSVDTFSGQGNEYRVGTVFAAAMYQAVAGNPSKLKVMQKSLLKAYDDSTTATLGFQQTIALNIEHPENFNLEVMVDTILAHVTDDDLRRDLCGQFLDRLKVDRALLPHCPAAAQKGTACP